MRRGGCPYIRPCRGIVYIIVPLIARKCCVVLFHRAILPTSIEGTYCNHRLNKKILFRDFDIGMVKSYLAVHLNNKLDMTDLTAATCKKGQSRLHLLRRLRSFGVQGAMLRTFYDSLVALAIFYGVVC